MHLMCMRNAKSVCCMVIMNQMRNGFGQFIYYITRLWVNGICLGVYAKIDVS